MVHSDHPANFPDGWKPPLANVSWVKRKFLDVPYDHESANQRLDLYLPDEGKGPFPLLVHIHGGGFAFGDKRDDHINAFLKGLTHGLAIASVEYRFSGEAVFPAAVLDCREAIRYLRVHAGEYSIDPERIAVIGGSAGGNLAAMLGMNVPNGEFYGEDPAERYCGSPKVAAAVDQYGPMRFLTMFEQARRNGVSEVDPDPAKMPESKYIGATITDVPELTEKANPAYWASSRMAPMLVQHGTADHLVPYEQSVEFVEALKVKGLGERVEFMPLPGAVHDDQMFFQNQNMNIVFAFLEKHFS